MTPSMLKSRASAGVIFLLLSLTADNLVRLTPFASAQALSSHCVPVGGALMTNIGAIAGVTNLGPASGDLAGSLAATILGQNRVDLFIREQTGFVLHELYASRCQETRRIRNHHCPRVSRGSILSVFALP
jgi:hypothetical protein